METRSFLASPPEPNRNAEGLTQTELGLDARDAIVQVDDFSGERIELDVEAV